MKELERLRELIDYWIEFSKSHKNEGLSAFGKWLYNRTAQPKQSGNPDFSVDEIYSKKMQLGYLFGQLSNFTDLWGKLAFKDLPIRSFEDYGILKEVEYKKSPSKNELAGTLVNEKSTAFEIIKRLIRDGMLKEHIDPEDKRIRRVQLTDYGKKIAQQADQMAAKVSELLVGHSTDEEIDLLLKIFSELETFHSNLHSNVPYESIDDLIK